MSDDRKVFNFKSKSKNKIDILNKIESMFLKNDDFKYDEFVSNNMSEEGYNKMIGVLEEYLKKVKNN